MLRESLLPCLFLAATAAPALAQDFVIEPGSIEVGELIDRAAQHLGWNILVNPQELGNCGEQLKIQNRIATDTQGCEDLLTTMLSTRAIAIKTLDREKKLYEAISLHGPRARELFSAAPQKSVDEVLARPNLRVPVTTVIQLQHTNAVIANNSLRPFFASSGAPGAGTVTIGNVGNTTSLLISGMQDQVASAIRIIRQCDVPPSEPRPGAAERLAELEQRIAALEQAIAELKKEKKDR